MYLWLTENLLAYLGSVTFLAHAISAAWRTSRSSWPKSSRPGKGSAKRGCLNSSLLCIKSEDRSVLFWLLFTLSQDAVNRIGHLRFSHLSTWVVLTTRLDTEASCLQQDSWWLGRELGRFCSMSTIHGAWSLSWGITCHVIGLQRH